MLAFDLIFILCSSLLVSSSSQSTTEINDAFLKAEPQVDQLISGDFQVKTQKGKWLIFFGSTMCIHCKAFTPDWLTLQQETKNSYKFVNMGKVDCPTNPDLCKDITGYPTLKLYRDGQFIEEIENRELKNLRSYVKAAHDESLALSKDQGYAKLNELVGQELSGDSKVNPDGKVIDLTDKDFEKLTTAQPWMLMFYAPWCGHCKEFKPIYQQLAPRLVVACNKFGIKGYPTLYFANEPEQRIEFQGQRTLEGVEKFATDIVSTPSFIAIKPTEIEEIIKKSSSVAIFVTDGSKTTDLEVIHSITKSVRGAIPFYICPDKDGYKFLKITPQPTQSTLVIYTDNGIRTIQHRGVYVDTDKNKVYIQNWIMKNKNALVEEFTVSTQKELTSSSYLVIAILDPTDINDQQKLENLKMVANEFMKEYPKLNNLRFSYLNGLKFGAYAEQVYGVKATEYPRFVVTHPKDEVYYDKHVNGDTYEFTKESVFKAIVEVMDGQGSPKSTKGFIGLMVLKIKLAFVGLLKFASSLFGFVVLFGVFLGSVWYCCFKPSGYSSVSAVDSKID